MVMMQYCVDASGRWIKSRCVLIMWTNIVNILVWAVNQRSRFDYMYHCLNTPKEVNLTGHQVPPTTLPNVFESMQRSQVYKILTKMAHWRRQRLKDVGWLKFLSMKSWPSWYSVMLIVWWKADRISVMARMVETISVAVICLLITWTWWTNIVETFLAGQ